MNADIDANEEYVAAWQDLKRRRRLCLFLILGFLPIGGGIGAALSSLLNSEIPFVIVGGAWWISVPISQIYLYCFRCPRCEKLFFFRFGLLFHNPFKLRCVHCGILPGRLGAPDDVAEDIATISIQSRRSLKRIGLIGFTVSLFLLIAIAVATIVGQKLIAKPQMVAEQFLQQVQAHQYQQAHKLLTPQRQSQLEVQTLQHQWQTFEMARGKTSRPKWAGAGGWPTKSVTLYYEIPDNKGRSGGAKFDMVANGDAWQVEEVTFYKNKADMFPSKPTSHSKS